MANTGQIEKVGKYLIREQPFDEIHRDKEGSITLCGVNPFGHFQNVRRFVAELDGEVVGDGWCLTSKYNPWGRLGHFGVLADEHKQKGLGGRLLNLCIEAVREAGMEAMFVDTGPSIAHLVYEKAGFEDAISDHPEWMGLRYGDESIETYTDRYFEIREEDELSVRALDFSYLNEIQVLLNGFFDKNVLVKNYLLTLFADDQLHEGQILVEIPGLSEGRDESRRVQMIGVFSGFRLVGFATLAPWRTTRWDNRHEAHIGLMDIYLHPSFWQHDICRVFFEGIRNLAGESGYNHLRTMETSKESSKTDILLALGFRVKYEMREEVIIGEGEPVRGVYPQFRYADVAAYEMSISEPDGFRHPYRVPWDN